MAYANYFGGWTPGYMPQPQPAPDMLAQFKSPYQPPQPQPQPNSSGLIWVQGESGAKSFMVAPGQSVPLMDSEPMVFYIKTADGSGVPLPLRTFHYTEAVPGAAVPEKAPEAPKPDYVTRDEFEARVAELLKKEAKKV